MRRLQDLVRPPARKASCLKGRSFQAAVENIRCCLSTNRGNILVYIVLVIVIFAALGVTMLSLFSTSTSSSAVANDDHRAFYFYESGYRYALSELTRTSFSSGSISTLNTTTYSLPNGQFLLNVFGPWFDSTAYQERLAGQSLNLSLPRGKLPGGFTIPAVAPYVSVVNFDYAGASIPASGSAEVTVYSYTDATHFSLTVGDDFVANNNERICLAVHPDQAQTVSDGGNLTVALQAQGIFPKFNGAIEVNRKLYFYRERVDDPINVKTILTHLKAKSGSFTSFPVTTADYVILSPANYYIVPEGRSSGVTYGARMDYAVSAYDVTPFGPADPKPDIKFEQETDLFSMLSQNETTSGFANVDNTGKKVTFERTSGTPFGSVFFKDTRAIGGQKNYCQNGACLFNDGIRAFFVMTFAGGGDGFTFSLINGNNNTASSVGGDFQLGELLGYAGDSRLNNNNITPTSWLDGTGNGLRAPKMALEFDGYYNNTSLAYCYDANNVASGRYDPPFSGTTSGGKDNVQYIFWGSRNPLVAPCRGNSPLYDDNRHDSKETSAGGEWTYPARALESSNASLERVKTGPDGTVYAIFGNNSSSSDSRLVALEPSSGALKWQIPTPISPSGEDDLDALAVDSAGNIYLGSDQHFIFAMKPDGSQLWSPVTTDTNVDAPIAVDESRNRIYFASGAGLYALDKRSGGTAAGWTDYFKSESGDIDSGVTVDPVDGRVYFGTNTSPFLYAVASNGGWMWKYPADAGSPLSGDIRSRPAVNPANRDVIFGSSNNSVYGIDYLGNFRWRRATTGAVEASPIVTTDATPRVYVGNLAGVFYCLNATNGAVIWQYPSSGMIGAIRSKAAVDFDGTIYFGCDDNKVYALNSDGTLKWTFSTGGSVKSAIEIGKNGSILFISDDQKLYSINPYTTPRNLRSLYLTDVEVNATGASGENWFNQGTWAVRVEVDRSQTVNARGNYEYTLRTWMRKCTDTVNCSDIASTLFGSTRLRYDYNHAATPKLPMTQTIELSLADHTLFNRFLFGFTSGSGSNQTIEIRNFQLSFIRPNDPVVTTDPDWL
jgi:outer membrane protein assembly factor BamB